MPGDGGGVAAVRACRANVHGVTKIAGTWTAPPRLSMRLDGRILNDDLRVTIDGAGASAVTLAATRSSNGKTKTMNQRTSGAAAIVAMLALSQAWHAVAQAPSAPAPAAAPNPELDVPYVTTPDHVVAAMMALAGVGPRDYLIDLGSGDGRIVISAAVKHGARGFGVEIDPRLVQASNESAQKAGVASRVKFVEQDLFATNLRDATVITMYLLPDVNLKLRPELLKLAPGTRIVSHDWDMGDWEPDRKVVIDVPEKKLGIRKESTLMLWKIPATLGGSWLAGKNLALELTQKYQKLSGRASYHGQTYTDTTGRIDGNRVELCFTHHANGSCRLGALGELKGNNLRLLVDGEGRKQVTLVAHRATERAAGKAAGARKPR
jgi:hypothetical protein